LSESEFEKKYLGLLPPTDSESRSGSRRKREVLDASQCKDVPEAKNWNAIKRVPKVKDQKECGSCYIFSSTAAIESAVAIENGIEALNMSRQNSLDCVKDPKTDKPNGCNAGRPEWIWKAAKEADGLVQETKENEYTGSPNKECNTKAAKALFSDVDYWERIPNKGSPEEVEDQIKCRLATSGPFHVSMTVRKNDMGSFKSGVYKNSDGICVAGENVNHGLLLVGYGEKLLEGDRKPTKFWIIQNSWGERWGEQGFVNVERGTNLCNFATDAYFPVLKKTLNPIEKPSLCKETHDIFDATKNYVKSLCFIEDEKAYEESQLFCLKNGMRLFRTDSKEARESLLTYANKEWNDLEDFTPYIGGVTTNDSGSPVCNSIEKDGETFIENDKTDCADNLSSICEFVNKKPDEKQ
jgi:C1A family cysteine protease